MLQQSIQNAEWYGPKRQSLPRILVSVSKHRRSFPEIIRFLWMCRSGLVKREGYVKLNKRRMSSTGLLTRSYLNSRSKCLWCLPKKEQSLKNIVNRKFKFYRKKCTWNHRLNDRHRTFFGEYINYELFNLPLCIVFTCSLSQTSFALFWCFFVNSQNL